MATARDVIFSEKLGSSLQAETYRGYLTCDPSETLAIKRINFGLHSREIVSSLAHQMEQVQTIDAANVIVPNQLIEDGEDIFLVHRYFNHPTLSVWMDSQPRISIEDFFTITIQLAQLLHAVHSAGIIHRGLKPNNVLISVDTLEVFLLDVVRTFDETELSHFIYDEMFRQHTLAYISPEQTGRIHQRIDYPADFYSLGVIFYQLLTSQQPFLSKDPLALIHSHLADEALVAHALNPEVPETLSGLVVKLMSKSPEYRYRSASSLVDDLKRCQKQYSQSGEITSFSFEKTKNNFRVVFPAVMVGRQSERKQLLDAFNRACDGCFQAAFLSGLPGMGKTRLIQELQTPTVSQQGYFTFGKFDQYSKHLPYATLIEAFSRLMRTLLTEEEARLQEWRTRIRLALGANGKLITEIIPELELIIGPQPDVANLPPREAHLRFTNVAGRFIASLATKGTPLTLFIDDLQWCDTATFEIISLLLANPAEYPYLFLLGAYRHNEVDDHHPLTVLLQKCELERDWVQQLRVDGLNISHCTDMLAHLLGTEPSKAEPLSELVWKQTDGNPLFVAECLVWLQRANLLEESVDGGWHWNLDEIKGSSMPDNVVALFANKINVLPKETREMLAIGSCIGASFDAKELCLVAGIDQAKLYLCLAPALEQGLLRQHRQRFSFLHDRVQEAVSSALDARSKTKIHAQIAESYLAKLAPETDFERLDRLFEIARHLNHGRDSAHMDEATRCRDSTFNFHAGNKAVSTLALDDANYFYHTAYDLLPGDCWATAYNLSFEVCKNLAMNECALGRQTVANELFLLTMDNARSELEQAQILVEQVILYGSLGEFEPSIKYGKQALKLLGQHLPDPGESVAREIDKLIERLKGPQPDSPPQAIDEVSSTLILRCYNQLLASFYVTGHPDHFLYLGLSGYLLPLASKTNLIEELLCYPLSACGGLLRLRGEYELSDRIEAEAMQLRVKAPNSFGAGRGGVGLDWLSLHWTQSIEEVDKSIIQTIQTTRNCGDALFVSGAQGCRMMVTFLQGFSLVRLAEEAADCRLYAEKHNSGFGIGLALGIEAAVLAPLTKTDQPIEISHEIELWRQTNNSTILFNYYVHLAATQYFLGNNQACIEALETGQPWIVGMRATVPERLWYIFSVLAELKSLQPIDRATNEKRLTKRIGGFIEKIEVWAAMGPVLRPYLAFIRAEKARLLKPFNEARNLYLDAIDTIHDQQYLLLEGFAHERLGTLFAEQGHKQAQFHIQQSAACYRQCHAVTKFAQLEEQHSFHIRRSVGHEYVDTPLESNLDTNYLLKMVRRMSQALDLDELLQTVIQSIVESVGATQGYLLILEEGELQVCAFAEKDNQEKVSLVDVSKVQGDSGYCLSIPRYVYRTGESLILSNAATDEQFSSNKEVNSLALVSVLCQPIKYLQETIGVLFLSNSLLASAFSQSDVELITYLGSQAAIAIVNARLLADQKLLLHQEKERAQITLESIADAVIRTDGDGLIEYLNPVAERITGYSEELALGKPLSEIFRLIDEKTREPFEDAGWRNFREGKTWNPVNDTILVSRNNEEVSIESSASPILDGEGKVSGMVLVFHDVTESRQMAKQISYQAKHDPLTGLVNRYEFEVRLKALVKSASKQGCRHGLLYLDLDQFKIVNDTCGHVAGDELLRQVAVLFQDVLRSRDMIARLGGDEFGVLLEHCSLENSYTVALGLLECLKKFRFGWIDKNFVVGVSIGLVPVTHNSGSIERILSAADAACYTAKEKGRNRVHVFEPDDMELTRRQGEMNWVSRIQQALYENRFCLYFQRIQPINNEVNSGDVYGELLVRMLDPEGQLVSPQAFIPAAERYDQMIAIDRWVICNAFSLLADEMDQSSDKIYSINISGQSLSDKAFLEYVNEQMISSGVSPSNICFEITETAAVANLSQATEFILVLKRAGCKFSLDDFGSGLSSFSYLSALNVDYLKIDGSFVIDIADDPVHYAMVKAINELGHVMGMKTIAECVENNRILECLKDIGVDYAQGYGIHKPCVLEKKKSAKLGNGIVAN